MPNGWFGGGSGGHGESGHRDGGSNGQGANARFLPVVSPVRSARAELPALLLAAGRRRNAAGKYPSFGIGGSL